MDQLNWQNLQENKCPSCGKDFVGNSKKILLKNGEPGIEHIICGFQISERKYAQIVSSQINQSLIRKEEYEQNL